MSISTKIEVIKAEIVTMRTKLVEGDDNHNYAVLGAMYDLKQKLYREELQQMIDSLSNDI